MVSSIVLLDNMLKGVRRQKLEETSLDLEMEYTIPHYILYRTWNYSRIYGRDNTKPPQRHFTLRGTSQLRL